MHASPILLSIWLVLLLAFVGVMVYRSTLANHETEQMFLNEDGTSHAHADHDAVAMKVKRIAPACYGLGAATGVMTIVLLGQTVLSGAGF